MIDRADSWARLVDSNYGQLGVRVLRAQLAIAEGNWEQVFAELGDSPTRYARDSTVNQGLTCLAVLSDAFRMSGNLSRLQESIVTIEKLLPISIKRGRVDLIMDSYCRGLIALGEDHRANETLSAYLQHQRRERGSNEPLVRLMLNLTEHADSVTDAPSYRNTLECT